MKSVTATVSHEKEEQDQSTHSSCIVMKIRLVIVTDQAPHLPPTVEEGRKAGRKAIA